jgi:hypothetical protein
MTRYTIRYIPKTECFIVNILLLYCYYTDDDDDDDNNNNISSLKQHVSTSIGHIQVFH